MSEKSVTFTMPLTDAGREWAAAFTVSAEREIRLTGSADWPRTIHRGQQLTLRINGETFEGSVKWRRGRVLVMVAKLRESGR